MTITLKKRRGSPVADHAIAAMASANGVYQAPS